MVMGGGGLAGEEGIIGIEEERTHCMRGEKMEKFTEIIIRYSEAI